MPTIEFECHHCGHKFKQLVFKEEKAVESTCPNCGGNRIERQPGPQSLFHNKELFGDFIKDRN
jgi:putative FmdB family regulatory protein